MMFLVFGPGIFPDGRYSTSKYVCREVTRGGSGLRNDLGTAMLLRFASMPATKSSYSESPYSRDLFPLLIVRSSL